MANLKSSKKDIRRATRKAEANKGIRTGLKTYIKKVRQAVESGDQEKMSSALSMASHGLDKAVQRGVIHKNQASRRKSRIASLVAKAGK